MGQFLQDSTNQIVSEANLSGILAHFNSELIFDIIEDNIDKKFSAYQASMPNIVNAYEQNFKQLQISYPFGNEEILQVRNDTYSEIIEVLCRKYNLTFNPEVETDTYSAAFFLYQFLVSSFKNNIVALFSNFIIKEKNYLYEALQLSRFKKDKDSNSVYNKKTYKNPKLGVIISQIEYVVDTICVADFTFDAVLKYMTPDKTIVDFLSLIVAPNSDFFKEQIVPIMKSDTMRSILLMDIRIAVQQLSQTNDVSIVEDPQV